MPSKTTVAVAGVVAAGAAMAVHAADDKYGFTRDLRSIRVSKQLKQVGIRFNTEVRSVANFWDEVVRTHGVDREAILLGDEVWTFGDIDALANRVARWCQSLGVKAGDVVALDMSNRAEYVGTWLGVTKLGAITAFLNTSLEGESLMHCVRISTAKHLIYDSPLAPAVAGVDELLREAGVTAHGWADADAGADGASKSVLSGLRHMSPDPVDPALRAHVKATDPWGLIFTSGTTGLPKAAMVPHTRMRMIGESFKGMFGVVETDRVYNVLPLFHSSGGQIGVGLMMSAGATMILRPKFSTRATWDDVTKYRVTVMLYIGELCRYLVTAAPHPRETGHGVRIAIGNGLRPDVWGEFQERFGIPEVGEFYGSTEGNVALWNHCTDIKSRGACGFIGPLMRKANPYAVVKFDTDREEPVRDLDGRCVQCDPNEPGEMLGQMVGGKTSRAFAGYWRNKAATAKKVLRDVFEPGDAWFRTGDLMRVSPDGFIHFVDRIGDTFRWKGENVATTQVAEAVSTFPGIAEVNVYGVAVPGADGRAGCAAIVLDSADDAPTHAKAESAIDLNALARHLTSSLPAFAVPVFLRILPRVPITATFKHQKTRLRTDGVDPTAVSDPLFVLTAGGSGAAGYSRLDAAQWHTIAAGRSRL